MCRKTCEVLGYEIEAGTPVLVNAWAINRDPQYRREAESFRPERFEGKSIDFKGGNFEYLPFGAGRRICPGMEFGLATVHLSLAQLLLYFDWKLRDGRKPELDMSETYGVTVTRKTELKLFATPRIPIPSTIYCKSCSCLMPSNFLDISTHLHASDRPSRSHVWDAKVVHQLPEYMKDYYLKLMHTFEEFEDLLASSEKYRITYLKEVMKDLSEAYFEESKWRDQHYIPTLEEHLHVSLISSTYPMLECASFIGMGEIASKEAFEWITSFPKIVQASAIICHIMDDITSHELEQTRAHVASTVQCYMKEYGTNVQVACKKLQDLVEDAWKDINEECLNPIVFPIAFLERDVNFSRMMEKIYKQVDGYTNSSSKMKYFISLLLVHPIPI
ncbi:unnamed protein product [Musa textilis]